MMGHFWNWKFGRKYNSLNRRDSDFGAQYKVSDVTLNKHRGCECGRACFLAVEKNCLICKRMWGDAGHDYLLAESSTGERRGLEKSTPDSWLFVCAILRQCALYDMYMITSRQFTLFHNTHLWRLVDCPCFCCPHVFLSSFILVSVCFS